MSLRVMVMECADEIPFMNSSISPRLILSLPWIIWPPLEWSPASRYVSSAICCKLFSDVIFKNWLISSSVILERSIPSGKLAPKRPIYLLPFVGLLLFYLFCIFYFTLILSRLLLLVWVWVKAKVGFLRVKSYLLLSCAAVITIQIFKLFKSASVLFLSDY